MMLSIAFTLFLLMNPVGNVPLYMSILKNIPHERHKKIIVREMVFAWVIMIIFIFLGQALLDFLHINQYTIQLAGGIVLFIISLRMVFPTKDEPTKDLIKITEPYIVPLAIPLVAGPSILSAVILYSHQVQNNYTMIGSISIAWAFLFIILYFSPLITKILKDRGVIAIERLMGLIMIFIAIQMFMNGIKTFSQIPYSG